MARGAPPKAPRHRLAADHLPVNRRRVRPLVERQPDRLLQGRDRQEVCRELPHRPPVRRLHRAGEQQVAPRAQRSRWSSRDSSLQSVRQSGVRRWGEASAPAASCAPLRRRASPSHGSGVPSRRPEPGRTPPPYGEAIAAVPAAAAALLQQPASRDPAFTIRHERMIEEKR